MLVAVAALALVEAHLLAVLAVAVTVALLLSGYPELQILVVAAAVLEWLVLVAAKAAQASSSFPMLAHNNLVAVSSLLLVVTPFTHLQLLALLFQSHLCLHPIWLLLVVAVAVVMLVVAAEQEVCCQALALLLTLIQHTLSQ
jgi:hypothetical protein